VSWTKKELIKATFDAIGISGFEFDLQPEDREAALRRLDAMMATWNADGLRLGYPLHNSPADSDITEDAGVPDSAIEAVIENFSLRIAPIYKKPVTREQRVTAMKSYDTLMMRQAGLSPEEKKLPGTLPLGQGNKGYRRNYRNYVYEDKDDVSVGPDSILDLF
jgi:hypothetical protein